MKTWILAGMVGACALLANAQTIPESYTVNVPGGRLQTIELPAHRYFMDLDTFSDYKGAYDLSDGQVLTLRNAWALSPIMYARIGNQEEHRVIAASKNTFVALDRQLEMRIDLRDDGSVGGEVLMMVPEQTMASGQVVPEHMQTFNIASR